MFVNNQNWELHEPAWRKICKISKVKKNIFESQEIVKMDPEALKNLSGAQKEELMRNVQQQVALANMQELLTVKR